MFTKKMIWIVIVLTIAGVSCSNGGYTLRLEGRKDGIGGAIEYTFNPQKSKEMGLPVSTDKDGNSFYGLSNETINKINGQLEKLIGVGIKATSNEPTEPMRKLIELLNQLHKKEN